MTRTTKWALRAAATALLFVSLAAPGPGYIGGCGSTVAVADPYTSCFEMESWECQRERIAGRIDDAELMACNDAIQPICAAFQFPPGCNPLESQVEACVHLLRRGDLLPFTVDQLKSHPDHPECRNLCM